MQTLSHCITFWTSGFSVDCVHHMIDEVLCVVDDVVAAAAVVVVAAGVGPVGCFTFRHEKDAPTEFHSCIAFSKDTDNYHPATNKTLLEGLLLSMKCSFIRAPAWTKLEAGNVQRDFCKVHRLSESATVQHIFDLADGLSQQRFVNWLLPGPV